MDFLGKREDTMGQKLYLECYAGISGDMTVAALLDLGADADKLKRALDSLHLDGYAIEISRVKKSGLDVCDFAVKLDEAHENHDHDMEYLHGADNAKEDAGAGQGHDLAYGKHCGRAHSREAGHSSGCSQNNDYSHRHDPKSGHGQAYADGRHHTHRGLPEIMGVIRNSEMTEHAKEIAGRIFRILAEAEAEAHGVMPDEVHFHEVGAVDSIVDIAAAAICLDDLGIEEVIVPVLYEGCGHIRCRHGMMPVPAPATLNIVSAHHIALHQTGTEGEFVTPTGAAIVAAIRTEETVPARYTVEKTGLGAGKRNYEKPSILRAMIISPEEKEELPANGGFQADEIIKLECNVDDCSGEAFGYTMERLLAAGARDVCYTPVFMKKNRPGYMVSVICAGADREEMERILFAETTTIGIRRQVMKRTTLRRENQMIATSLGSVSVKVLEVQGEKRYAPEFESVAAIARERGIPFLQVYKTIEYELSR